MIIYNGGFYDASEWFIKTLDSMWLFREGQTCPVSYEVSYHYQVQTDGEEESKKLNRAGIYALYLAAKDEMIPICVIKVRQITKQSVAITRLTITNERLTNQVWETLADEIALSGRGRLKAMNLHNLDRRGVLAIIRNNLPKPEVF